MTILVAPHVEAASGGCGEVAIARGINKHLGRPSLAAGFGFGDHMSEAFVFIHPGGDHARVQADADAGLHAHFLEHAFHALDIVAIGPCAICQARAKTASLKALEDFLHHAGFVFVIDDPSQRASSPDSAKATMQLDQRRACSFAGGGNRRSNSGRPAATNHHIRLIDDGS